MTDAREQFLTGTAPAPEIVTPEVLNSWRRSRALRVHPDRVDPPFMHDPDTDTPLVQAATPVLRRIASDLASQAVSVILTSADGLVLQRVAADPSMADVLDDVRLAQGYSYAEQFAGTNGIGTTLETRLPTFIRGSEHYLGPLGRLACAGSPIRDPMTGRLLGVVDLTCWASQADPLLFVLAKSAGSQIEDRITALHNEHETALLDAYLRHGRRYPGGVLAVGGEVVLMNQHLRQILDAGDQTAVLDHAADLISSSGAATVVATLPSGHLAKISVAEEVTSRGRRASAVLHVHVQDPMVSAAGSGTALPSIPKLSGRSSSWRRSCHQVERSYRDREWVVIEGERGAGRAKLGQAVPQHVSPGRSVRVLRLDQYRSTDEFVASIETHTEGDDFAVVIANVDELADDILESLASILQTRAGRGWIAVTMGAGTRTPTVDILILPFFTHTVSVAPLRHRAEDLDDLVPALLKELTRGADVRLGADAMHQLAKLPWPGNVSQLRKVLAATVSQQRSGIIGADKLPAECRSMTRRTLTPLEALERDAIVRSLQEHDGNKTSAAEALGMSRATIYRKVRDFGIS